jgi:hypothetical protein
LGGGRAEEEEEEDDEVQKVLHGMPCRPVACDIAVASVVQDRGMTAFLGPNLGWSHSPGILKIIGQNSDRSVLT